MNILPKNYSQFKEKEYWDHFFKQLQNKQKPFDWYGTLDTYRNPLFLTLNTLYNSNGKQKRIRIAHIGCGNSTLPFDLLKAYPMFDFSILNLDYSEAVIKEMQVKAAESKLQTKLIYQVCDLLKPLEGELLDNFQMVIDKGTLDAILPEDKPQNVKEIQEVYFKNVEKMLVKNKYGHYVIMSMLQSFVLKAILDFFYKSQNYSISLTECALVDSELQPFLIDIVYHPLKIQSGPIRLNLLTKATVLLESPEAVFKKIQQLQQLSVYTKSIKNLRPGQISKFNLHLPGTQKLRYMLDIADHSDESVLLKNSCAVFIVPPGLEAQFAGQSAIKQLQAQVSTSRLIVAKLVVGQSVKSVQEVKGELNSILSNIIQKGCNPNEVPYLTDGTFEERQYLFRDDQIFIEQVMQSGESYRRLILKNSPSFVQSQCKLTYFSQKNHPQLKLIPSLTLPHKKGMLPGIDPAYLDEGYCRTIVAGLTRLLPKGLGESQGLHLGGGAASIPNFLCHKFPQATQTIVEISKSVIVNCQKYFQWPVNNPRFTVINNDALTFLENKKEKDQYDFIIVDISSNQQVQACYPPKEFRSQNFIRRCIDSLRQGGILAYNAINLQQKQHSTNFVDILDSFKEFGLVYRSESSSENIVYFAVKTSFQDQDKEGQEVIHIKNRLKNVAKAQFEWQQESIKDVELVRPESGGKFKQTGLVVVLEEQEKKKKKKKKK